MRIFTVLIVLLGCVTGTGCGTNSRDPAEPPDSASATPHLPTPQPDSSPEEVATPMSPIPATMQNLITAATEDLSHRLSIPTTEITMVEARAVTWSDSSLGCPVEGMMYAQVLTPGYLIVLEYSGSLYEYHAGRGPDIFHCENPIPPVPGMSDNT